MDLVGELHIGLSGYSYKEWQGEGLFYPPGMKVTEYFAYYVRHFDALEADGTWYQMPRPATVQSWITETPETFRVSPKMHRKVTHFARLKPEAVDALQFFVQRLEPLEKAGRLGAILIQLPPNLGRDDERLQSFLEAIPHRPSLPYAIEFRNESWHVPEVEALLKQWNVAWVGMETDEAKPQRRDTANHVYVRLRKSVYTPALLDEWVTFLKGQLEKGKSCYVFCKHEDAEQPWVWAQYLNERLRQR